MNSLGYLSDKRKVIMKAFITSQFSYCSLLWMFHSERLGKKINALHERALRITYGVKSSWFKKLLEKDNSASIHHKNLQALVMEMCKVSNNISPTISKDIFASRCTPYDLRNLVSFKIQKIYLFDNGTGTLSHLGPKIWSLVPRKISHFV